MVQGKKFGRWVAYAVIALVAGFTWFVSSYGPDTPAEYADSYGGSPGQYEAILTRTDCGGLGQLVSDMDDRYNRPSESRETQRIALGYMTAATDRMVAIDCP